MSVSTSNIALHVQSMAAARPNQIALHIPAGSGKYISITYAELWSEVQVIARALRAAGLAPGERAVLMVPPSREFFVLTFALFIAEIVPVFVDPGMGLKHLKRCLAEARPHAFIGITKAHIARCLFGWAKATVKTLVTVGPRLGWGGYSLPQLRTLGQTAATPAVPHPLPLALRETERNTEATAAILFTSGSTGVPKGAVYTHGIFNAQVEALRASFSIQPGEVDLCTFPLFALYAPALGMTAVIPRMDFTRPARIAPAEVWEPVHRFGVTNMFGSPALLNRVGRAAVEKGISLPSLRRVISAGAPVSAKIIERFTSLLSPGVQVFTPYGATESLPVAIIGSQTILGETSQATARGEGVCVGAPVSLSQRLPTGEEIPSRVAIIPIHDRPIANWSEDLALPTGTIGEIVVTGPQVTQAYFDRPDLSALAKLADPATGRAWHRMGDLGYLDASGRLWFCGRKSQRVVSAAGLLCTDRIEGIFNAHPAVFRSALVGIPARSTLEPNEFQTPIICIELESHAQSAHRQQLAQELLTLASHHPETRIIQKVLFHPAFPVDIRHNSKIFREKLAEWATSSRLRMRELGYVPSPLDSELSLGMVVCRELFRFICFVCGVLIVSQIGYYSGLQVGGAHSWSIHDNIFEPNDLRTLLIYFVLFSSLSYIVYTYYLSRYSSARYVLITLTFLFNFVMWCGLGLTTTV